MLHNIIVTFNYLIFDRIFVMNSVADSRGAWVACAPPFYFGPNFGCGNTKNLQ